MVTKVSDLITDFLEKLEIKVVFGIIGSANSHIFDSITRRGYTQIVCVHHEQAAVMAMGAYYRASGKLSAAIVTAGAGSSNAITGVISNWADSIPGFIISGQESTVYLENHKNLRMYGIQGFNSSKMVQDVTKYSVTVKNEKNIQTILEIAHDRTINGRPGPVWVDVPFDIQSKTVEFKEWYLTSGNIDILPELTVSDIKYVVDAIKNSKRPIIWAGNGVRLSTSKEQFRKFVELYKIPTILTWTAIDLLDDKNPYYFGRAGVTGQRRSNFIVQNSDLIIVLGSRMSLMQTGYNTKTFAPNAKVIFVNNDYSEWEKNKDIYDHFVQMDCKLFIESMLSEVVNVDIKEWLDYCNLMKMRYPLIEPDHWEINGVYLNSHSFVDTLSDYLHDNQIIVTDMGTGLLSGHYSIKIKPNQTMFTSLGLGEMGYGLPGAIGASFTDRTRQVLCLNCDGGMMMNLQELQTIIHHKLPIKIIIFNNDGYLMIKNTQKLLFKGSYNCVNQTTGLSLPDYGKVGKAFGFETYRLDQWKNVEEVLSKFLGSMEPAICEVFMNPEQEFVPKVKASIDENGVIIPATLEDMSPKLPIDVLKEAMPWGIVHRTK